jgi:hypothetical protein
MTKVIIQNIKGQNGFKMIIAMRISEWRLGFGGNAFCGG